MLGRGPRSPLKNSPMGTTSPRLRCMPYFPMFLRQNRGEGIVKLTGCREAKPPHRVFRNGFTTDIFGLYQLVMR